MSRPRNGTKYGSAESTEVWSCPDGHVHLIGKNEAGELEYEIVLGKALIEIVQDEIDHVRSRELRPREPNPPSHH